MPMCFKHLVQLGAGEACSACVDEYEAMRPLVGSSGVRIYPNGKPDEKLFPAERYNLPKETAHERPGVVFLANVPAGASMIAVDGKVIVVAPGMPASYVTPDGLVPIPLAEGVKE